MKAGFKWGWMIVAGLLFVLMALGCDDQDVNDDTDGDVPGDGPTVEVVYGDDTTTVDLSQFEATEIDGEAHVSLADVVMDGAELAPLGDFEFDFAASDGFTPLGSPNCLGIVPLPGEYLTQGQINIDTMRLVWDETLEFPGCLSVKDLAQIIVTDAVESATVEVTFGDASVDVRLATLPSETFQDVEAVKLADVIAAAHFEPELADLQADFEASDGFRPGNSGNCEGITPVAGADLELGYLSLDTLELLWDDELDFPGCMGVEDIALIELSDLL